MALGIARVLAGRGGVEEIRRSVNLLTGSDVLDDDPRRMALLVLGPLFLRESGTGRELIGRVVAGQPQPRCDRHAADVAVPPRHATTPPPINGRAHRRSTTSRSGWPGKPAQSTELAASLAGLGWLEARQGLRTDCVAHLSEAAELCDAHQIHLFRGWCLFGQGDLESAVGIVGASPCSISTPCRRIWPSSASATSISRPDPELVDLLVRLDRFDEAAAIAAEYHRRASSQGAAVGDGQGGASAWRCARPTTTSATELFAAAFDWHGATLDDFERAKTLLAQGSRLRRRRRRVAAGQPLRAALGIFDTLGCGAVRPSWRRSNCARPGKRRSRGVPAC